MSDDAVFRALADSSRRELLDRLRDRDGRTSQDLCRGLAMSRQAVAKHLSILEKAGLVSARWKGREKLHFVNTTPIADVTEGWMARFHRSLPPLTSLARASRLDEENGTVRKPADPQVAADRPRLPPLSSLRSSEEECDDDDALRPTDAARSRPPASPSSMNPKRSFSLPGLRSLATTRPKEDT